MRRLVILSAVCFVLAGGFAHAAAKQCSLGVFPFLSAQRLESIFAPIAAELSKATDCDFHYNSAGSYRSFMDKLKKRKYDVAYVQPFDYVRVAVPHGYLPLAARDSQLTATLVARRDKTIDTLEDLKGATIALPPKVAAVSYLTRAALENDGIDPDKDVKLVYTKNHGSCLQQVLIGKADACGTVDTVANMFEKHNHIKLKWVAQTPSVPQALFVVRDDVPPEQREQLLQAFLTMPLTPAGLRLFRNPENGRLFRKIEDKEYDVVRRYWRRFQPDKAN